MRARGWAEVVDQIKQVAAIRAARRSARCGASARIDLQNAMVGAPVAPHTGPEVAARAAELARAFREHRAPVVLVRVTARADGSDATPGRNEIQAKPGSLPEGWDVIVDDLAGHTDDITVTKRTWGAFHPRPAPRDFTNGQEAAHSNT